MENIYYLLDVATDKPLYWDHSCLTFDTEESAIRFINSLSAFGAIDTDYIRVAQNPDWPAYKDATNLICVPNGDDAELVEVN